MGGDINFVGCNCIKNENIFNRIDHTTTPMLFANPCVVYTHTIHVCCAGVIPLGCGQATTQSHDIANIPAFDSSVLTVSPGLVLSSVLIVRRP